MPSPRRGAPWSDLGVTHILPCALLLPLGLRSLWPSGPSTVPPATTTTGRGWHMTLPAVLMLQILPDTVWWGWTVCKAWELWGQVLGCDLLSWYPDALKCQPCTLTQGLTWETKWLCRGPGFPPAEMSLPCGASSCCPRPCWTQTWSLRTAGQVSPRSCSSHTLVSKG